MSTFWVLWELTIPLTILTIGAYLTMCIRIHENLSNGKFRKYFQTTNIIGKIFMVILFILYIPVYIILVILGIYRWN